MKPAALRAVLCARGSAHVSGCRESTEQLTAGNMRCKLKYHLLVRDFGTTVPTITRCRPAALVFPHQGPVEEDPP
jgi:hypothetical protein